jgi:hypothetical protein
MAFSKQEELIPSKFSVYVRSMAFSKQEELIPSKERVV